MLPVILLAVTLPAATPCPEAESGEPAPAEIDGCAFAACVVSSDVQVCSCADAPDAARMRLGVRRGSEWSSRTQDVPAPFPGGPGRFGVRRVDLDGDGHDELVGTILAGISMGIVHERWTIVVWDGARPADPPVSFPVADFGAGSFARWPGERGCRVLATSWGAGSDPARGGGTYFYGRWLRYSRGALVPVGADGVLARRLLRSFLDELGPDAPLRWLRDGKAERLREPFLPDLARPQRRGTVVSAKPSGDHVDLTIAFDGRTTEYCYGSCPRDPHRLEWLGELGARLAYPAGYWSSELLAWPFEPGVTVVEGGSGVRGAGLWVTRDGRR